MTVLLLLLCAGVFLALVMAAAWGTQRRRGNAGVSDAFWSAGVGIAGLAVALVPAGADGEWTGRQVLVALLVVGWGTRLALHIGARSFGGPEDARYAWFRTEWGAHFQSRLFWFLMIQAAAGLLLVACVLLAARNPAPGLTLQDGIGVLVMIGAVMGEGAADETLRRFKADPANKGQVCDVGLWAWSRHPNYFFEWLVWCAYPFFAVNLSGAYPQGWLALAGPAFMAWLLIAVSGIPPLEAHMARHYGPRFAAYRGRVPAFFPRPPRSS